MDKAKPTAVLIKAPKADKSCDIVAAQAEPLLRIGQSKIADEHWKRICECCGGEARLLERMGVEDKRDHGKIDNAS